MRCFTRGEISRGAIGRVIELLDRLENDQRVSSRTFFFLLMTRETVIAETPASAQHPRWLRCRGCGGSACS